MIGKSARNRGYSTMEESMLDRIQRDEEGYKNSENNVSNKLMNGLGCVVGLVVVVVIIIVVLSFI